MKGERGRESDAKIERVVIVIILRLICIPDMRIDDENDMATRTTAVASAHCSSPPNTDDRAKIVGSRPPKL